MAKWMGFDSGGTEQLWEPEVLMDLLRVFKNNEPFSRADPNSPIFSDLENLHPSITWRKFRADGSFNPIFRRSNPLVKLGLTSAETTSATITALGDDVLSGIIDVSEVYAMAAKTITDEDGNLSMVRMCLAGLEAPLEEFSEQDIEFGISSFSDATLRNINDVLASVRVKQLRITSTTRKRRIKSFMNGLVYAGAFSETSNGWVLKDTEVAQFISSKTDEDFSKPDIEPLRVLKPRKTDAFSAVVTEDRGTAPFDLSESSRADPQQTALALERSNQLHEDLVGNVGSLIKAIGFEAFEDPNSFDIAIFKRCPALFEIKTVTGKNVTSQLRKAIVQLEEYRWRHANQFDSEPNLFVVLSSDPAPMLEPSYIDFVENDRGIKIIWQNAELIDLTSRPLREILIQP